MISSRLLIVEYLPYCQSPPIDAPSRQEIDSKQIAADAKDGYNLMPAHARRSTSYRLLSRFHKNISNQFSGVKRTVIQKGTRCLKAY
ncbi:unnamed protein product [Periconia digitata]|uniref:Uncharacterized protein n=1 Tax=Periconia digitata TaxID=1303443 RepID=A0A9W4XRP7_9PLEO|nr:unnamed protein product [Periconia digitata]